MGGFPGLSCPTVPHGAWQAVPQQPAGAQGDHAGHGDVARSPKPSAGPASLLPTLLLLGCCRSWVRVGVWGEAQQATPTLGAAPGTSLAVGPGCRSTAAYPAFLSPSSLPAALDRTCEPLWLEEPPAATTVAGLGAPWSSWSCGKGKPAARPWAGWSGGQGHPPGTLSTA